MFKGLTGLGALLKQAQEIGSRMKGLTEELRARRATGSAGGGMVEVELNGLIEVLRCHIDEGLLAQGDREMLEDLVIVAVNQAIQRGKELHAETLRSMTGGLEVPGLEDMMQKFIGPGAGGANETPAEKS